MSSSVLPVQTLRPRLDVQGALRWEKSPGALAERTRALTRTPSPGDGPRIAPPAPLPQQAASTGSRPVTPRLRLLPWAARRQTCFSGLTSLETRSCSGSGSACKAPRARTHWIHHGSGRRGTENNGRDGPAPRRSHWLLRTALGNSVF